MADDHDVYARLAGACLRRVPDNAEYWPVGYLAAATDGDPGHGMRLGGGQDTIVDSCGCTGHDDAWRGRYRNGGGAVGWQDGCAGTGARGVALSGDGVGGPGPHGAG